MGSLDPARRLSDGARRSSVQRYLAHKKTPPPPRTPIGLLQGPRGVPLSLLAGEIGAHQTPNAKPETLNPEP